MAGPSRDQTLSLLAAANNHGNLAVKLSSLRQVKDILFSLDPSFAAEVFPYLVELQSSPEPLVRKLLIEVIEEVGLEMLDHSTILMPVLVSLLKDTDPNVACQSIVSGMKFFCAVLEEISTQLHQHGEVEKWAQGMLTWIVRVKDAVYSILFESASVGIKLQAMKSVETMVLLFTSGVSDLEKPTSGGNRRAFNVSWLSNGNSILDPTELTSEANEFLHTLLDMLRSAYNLPGPLAIGVINCLAAIAKKRPHHYSTIFSALLEFNTNPEVARGRHASSLHYSVRSAFLGFLRSTHPVIVKSKDRLVRSLREMNAGDAADQVLRQVDKLLKSQERASLDVRAVEEEVFDQQPLSDMLRKRPMHHDDEPANGMDMAYKRTRSSSNGQSALILQVNDSGPDHASSNGTLPKATSLSSSLSLSPVEQMIAMMAALLAEGERGAESLELLVSQIHPDLLADIVIANLKHLPKSPPPLINSGSLPMDMQTDSLARAAQVAASSAATTSIQPLPPKPQGSYTSAAPTSTLLPDLPSSSNQTDSKRDPRRDPRRLDPRVQLEVPTQPIKEEATSVHPGLDFSTSSYVYVSLPGTPHVENNSTLLSSHPLVDGDIDGGSLTISIDNIIPKDEEMNAVENTPAQKISVTRDYSLSSLHAVEEKRKLPIGQDVAPEETIAASMGYEPDEHSPSVSNTSASEESCQDLLPVPSYVELSLEQEHFLREAATKRIVGSHQKIESSDSGYTRMAILSRLVSQVNADDHVTSFLKEGLVLDYQHQQGHELLMHVLYHLHSCMISESTEQSPADGVYDRLFLGVANSLLDTLPASDKSFSRLLGEAPLLTNSVIELLDKICCSEGSDQGGKDKHDGDRVTQGLGALWSLILGRPLHRKTCLHIVLKCSVHVQDDTRAKAIRLVANKLYPLDYLTHDIEQFAQTMLMSAVDQATDANSLQSGSCENGQRANGETSQQSDCKASVDIPGKAMQTDSSISFAEAQRLISLYFALCIKKPGLLRLVCAVYGHANKNVKQAIHRHISTLVRALGSSYTEVLSIISDAPKGCEHLIMLVIQILTEQTTPSSDLIATVRSLYETKLKDAVILIPVLSSFSKHEVLSIFPRLVDLPLDKFQTALAHILQGSAHTGPALTPAEVLVAIHDINPEKERIALKKVTEACSACFEQRTVFTHQVLAKALNQMVDQTPLPLLFMRTVIQSIDAFPTLVDFVMEILSRLVRRQIWKMPKLWVGFLKCVSQTQPHSCHVLLQLPPPQLESALNKHANLRSSLTAYASQPSVRPSLPRPAMEVLGLSNEREQHQPSLAMPTMNARI